MYFQENKSFNFGFNSIGAKQATQFNNEEITTLINRETDLKTNGSQAPSIAKNKFSQSYSFDEKMKSAPKLLHCEWSNFLFILCQDESPETWPSHSRSEQKCQTYQNEITQETSTTLRLSSIYPLVVDVTCCVKPKYA